MAFPERFIQELLERTDLVELFRSYVPVERRGADYLCRCPFHSEKTPSCSISPDKGKFYCFGCHAGGTAIQVVTRLEGLDTVDAIRYLADKAGMRVPEQEDDGFRVRRERLLEVNQRAARWFYDRLSVPEGETARAYMQRRGITPRFARRFGLGAAPPRWDGLLTALSAAGFTLDELATAGLVSRGQKGRYFDAFRNRLMFPIFDLRGQVVAFSGRALDDAPAKYKNSAETPLYRKRSTLYAAHLARKSREDHWILCEGNIDVLMLHQNGYDNAVATCGTALTDAQARIIARSTTNLVLAYDADAAGQNATAKAIDILDKVGVKVRVLQMTDAKDPDEFISRHGPEAFRRLIEGSATHVEFLLAQAEQGFVLTRDEDKIGYLRAAVPILAELSGQAERHVYAARVAERLGVPSAAVLGDVERRRRQSKKTEGKALQRELLRPEKGRFDRSAEMALALLLEQPELLARSTLTADDFAEPEPRELFTILQQNEGRMLSDAPEAILSLAARLQMTQNAPVPDASATLRELETRLHEQTLLRAARESGDEDAVLRAKMEIYKNKKVGGQ